MQHFVEGDIFPFHKGPGWLLSAMGDTLGTVHRALMHHAPLPTGIGAGYFAAMTPERAAAGYEKTLHTARALAENGGEALAADVANIEYRLALARRLGPVPFQVEDLTVVNTHGDYGLNQILCGDGCINAVIDWTSACRHPAVWEVLRSFLYADPASATGAVNLKGLVDYTAAYTARFPLTRNDLLNMGPVFFRQTAVSDYYGQYYASTAANKELFLHQARFTTAVLKWLEQNMDEMAARLAPLGK